MSFTILQQVKHLQILHLILSNVLAFIFQSYQKALVVMLDFISFPHFLTHHLMFIQKL